MLTLFQFHVQYPLDMKNKREVSPRQLKGIHPPGSGWTLYDLGCHELIDPAQASIGEEQHEKHETKDNSVS